MFLIYDPTARRWNLDSRLAAPFQKTTLAYDSNDLLFPFVIKGQKKTTEIEPEDLARLIGAPHPSRAEWKDFLDGATRQGEAGVVILYHTMIKAYEAHQQILRLHQRLNKESSENERLRQAYLDQQEAASQLAAAHQAGAGSDLIERHRTLEATMKRMERIHRRALTGAKRTAGVCFILFVVILVVFTVSWLGWWPWLTRLMAAMSQYVNQHPLILLVKSVRFG